MKRMMTIAAYRFIGLGLLISFATTLTAATEVPSITTSLNVAIEPVSTSASSGTHYRPDRVIARLKTPSASSLKIMGAEKARESQFEKLASESDLKIRSTEGDFAVLDVDTTRDDVSQALARLQQNENVELAQPDYIYTAFATTPNDPSYSKLWGLKNSGQTISKDHLTQSIYSTHNPGTSGRDMGLETAWDTLTDCSSVIVAVVDTGIDLDNDDLKDNLWSNASNQHGYDYINSDTDPTDDNGHGSHVAGTIGARGNNGVGTTGVCWRVQLMAVKVLDATGSGSTSGIISGINYAVANGAHIINMSLGGGSFDSAFQSAVNSASSAGVLVVVAAGNDGLNNSSSPTYPCNFPATNLICVGAVDQGFSIASFSNYSTTYVDIGAPGTNIISEAPNAWSTSSDLSLAGADWTFNNANYASSGGYLVNPSNWDGTTNLYAANVSDTAYTSVDMSGTVGGVAYITLRGESEYGADFLKVFERAAGGNPITGGTQIASLSGSTGGALGAGSATMRACAGSATCTLGLNFTSNGSTQKVGFRIERLQIDKKIASTTGLDGMNGTSMASPHVAGLAALVKANNPTFTATDLRAAILTTGVKYSSLLSYFATSAVANAPAALKFVDAPTGVSAAVVP